MKRLSSSCPARRLSSRLSRSWSAHLPFVERLRIASYSLQQTELCVYSSDWRCHYVLKIWTEGRYIPHVSGWQLHIVGACASCNWRDGVPVDFVHRFRLIGGWRR